METLTGAETGCAAVLVAVHMVPPTGAKVFAAHLVHAVDPLPEDMLLTLQGLHLLEPALEKDPAGQALQAVAPKEDEKDPAGQLIHSTFPEKGEYVPAAQ